jgi:hypothetical protein
MHKCASHEKSSYTLRTLSCLVVLFALCLVVSGLHLIGHTNAYFTTTERVDAMIFRAGVWIPEIEIAMPENFDQVFDEAPCISITSNIENVDVHYRFVTGTDEINGSSAPNTCFYPPETESVLYVHATNGENEKWQSDELVQEIRVREKTRPGDVVINEIMWMGSQGDKKDEWIELRNLTDHDIDLSGWRINNAGKGKGGHVQIPHGHTITANGYFLLTRKKWDDTAIDFGSKKPEKDHALTNVSGMHLSNDGEEITLLDHDKNVIDIAWKDKKWPDGYSGKFIHMSMERNRVIDDGRKKASWHTCVDRSCNDAVYWREEGLNFGTPGKENSEKRSWFDHDDDNAEHDLIKRYQDEESALDHTLGKRDKKEDEKNDEKENKKNKKDTPTDTIVPLPEFVESHGDENVSNGENVIILQHEL